MILSSIHRADLLAAENAAKTLRFIDRFCTDCHGDPPNESGVELTSLRLPPVEKFQWQTWGSVLEQVVLGEMPPSDVEQPDHEQKQEFIHDLRTALEEAGHDLDLFEKLKNPEFGNLISHEKLFSGEIKDAPFSPARLWRTSPNVFDHVKQDYGVDPKPFRQPFIVDDKTGIKDYASLLLADSAVVDVLLMNAGICADQLLNRMPGLKEIWDSDAVPKDDKIAQALKEHFRRVIYRDPTDLELNRYLDLYHESLPTANTNREDRLEAMRLTLMAVMLHHEAVYRIEIGLGETDHIGRRKLSSVETAFSIAYALTDQRPDQELLDVASAGQLTDKKQVQQQLERLLGDSSIEKPRILRFFQEFFGYGHAHKVFKDEKRSGGFSYYGENYPDMYERDADFFVINILEEDRDVFHRLLTSDEYFLLNRQTFRNTVYDFYLANQEMLDAGDFPDDSHRDVLDRLKLDHWGELNQTAYHHNYTRRFVGSVRAIKQIVKEVRQWKNTKDEYKLLHGMQPLYNKYPMVYDLEDNEQDFLLPQPYRRPNRSGMLTHPAWLIAHSLNDSTDPIRRGKWIQERLLAGLVPDVPITVDASIPEDHEKTLRQRLAGTEKQECWRCHRKMNPLGYPFEIYDDFGRYRAVEVLDKLPPVDGEYPSKPIHAVGFLSGTGDAELDGEVNDALDLISRLAESDRVRQSIIRHVFRYFLGRNEMLSDSVTLMEADQVYLETGGSFRAMLISLLTSDSFLYRR